MVSAMICRDCNQDLPLTEFYMNKGNPMPSCKACWCARVKLRRLTDPKVREYDRARAKKPSRIQRATATTKKWRQENPKAYRAQNAVNNAIRDGKLKRKPCEICAATQGVHAHHKDYAKPLDVTWLCARCHHRMHALFPTMEGVNKRKAA